MSQITSGVRAIFSSARIYDAFQNLLGASHIRRELVREFMRPVPGMRVLDIGCGTGEIIDFLPESVEYFGYDISPRYIDSAKRRFGKRAHFHCGIFDAQQANRLQPFDLVIALGVLHHISDIEACNLFKLAKGTLKPTGRVVTIDPCFVKDQNPFAHFLISHDRGQNVRTAEAYCALPGLNFGKIDGKLRHRSRIPYTEWVMECRR